MPAKILAATRILSNRRKTWCYASLKSRMTRWELKMWVDGSMSLWAYMGPCVEWPPGRSEDHWKYVATLSNMSRSRERKWVKDALASLSLLLPPVFFWSLVSREPGRCFLSASPTVVQCVERKGIHTVSIGCVLGGDRLCFSCLQLIFRICSCA